MRVFSFFWVDNSISFVSGKSVSDALYKLGFYTRPRSLVGWQEVR
jgi:hypothetical protein